MVTSSPLLPAEQPWIREDVSPVAKQPRQQEPGRFARSSSARFSRKLSYSSESEDLSVMGARCAAHTCGSEAESAASSVPEFDFETLEEKMNTTFSPLVSFSKRSTNTVTLEEDEPLTLFNQSPQKAETSAHRNTSTPRSRIPVPTTRSKSCERRNQNIVSVSLKHSKSGEVPRSHVVTPQRKLSTPVQPRLAETVKETERQLQKCLTKTPRSLLSNPTSATTRKVLKSKSSDNVHKHVVRQDQGSTTPRGIPEPNRYRRKSTDGSALHKVSIRTPKPKKGLTKSKSSEISRNHVVSVRKEEEEVVMRPNIQNLASNKPSSRSFVDWLKKRRNEN